jgi:putative ABC transport system permease protein
VLKATLRSFLAHKGRLTLSALAVVLSVAFVAGSLIFSDTLTRTFDRLFASTAPDVTVTPREELEGAVPSGATPTLRASLAERVAAIDGVASARAEAEIANVTLADAPRRAPGTGRRGRAAR